MSLYDINWHDAAVDRAAAGQHAVDCDPQYDWDDPDEPPRVPDWMRREHDRLLHELHGDRANTSDRRDVA